MIHHARFRLCATLVVGLAASCSLAAFAQGVTGYKQGQGAGPVTGAAGTSGSTGDSGLAKCDKPMGAVAVVEPQNYVMQSLSRYGLSSPVGLIRMMIQQSNCFIVVERGIGLQNAMQERQLAEAGQTRANSNMGGGQMVTADFILTPAVVFSESDAGGLGGVLGGVLSRRAPVVGAIAGGLKFKEAQTSMLLSDARSSVQVAAAEGSTKKADLRLGGALFGGGAFGAVGGYGNTNEGKIIAAAYMDNYNKIVNVVRGDPSLQRDVGTLRQEAAAGGSTKAGAVFNEGDVITPKIANVKLLASPAEGAKTLATLARGDELVVTGSVQNGFVKVQGPSSEGWVRTILVTKK
ncbi:MAG: CsgG/HfaB family protein [Steroidobacteraceae bacterium]